MADACPNCGVWLGNEPLPNDSAWERQQAKIERLQAAGDALATNYELMLEQDWSSFLEAFLYEWKEARRER